MVLWGLLLSRKQSMPPKFTCGHPAAFEDIQGWVLFPASLTASSQFSTATMLTTTNQGSNTQQEVPTSPTSHATDVLFSDCCLQASAYFTGPQSSAAQGSDMPSQIRFRDCIVGSSTDACAIPSSSSSDSATCKAPALSTSTTVHSSSSDAADGKV